MRFSILTIHPHFFDGPFSEGLLSKAVQQGALQISIINIRDFADPPHFRVDDHPYGGGPGMILKVEPIVRAIRSVVKPDEETSVVVLAAKGKLFTQSKARQWAKNIDHLVLICGRYEGIDERVSEFFANEEVRVGNYVLMGGESAAVLIVEAVGRLRPGVLGNPDSLSDESFAKPGTREYQQFTRPPKFEGRNVPDVLLGGNHAAIRKWRKSGESA